MPHEDGQGSPEIMGNISDGFLQALFVLYGTGYRITLFSVMLIDSSGKFFQIPVNQRHIQHFFRHSVSQIVYLPGKVSYLFFHPDIFYSQEY